VWLTAYPCRVNSAAKRRVLLPVQRNGDAGSPRVTGSTKASKAAGSPGTSTVSRFRPPPARLIRDGASGRFCANSAIPRTIVFRANRVARATTAIPPRPRARASLPAHSRRCRSFMVGSSASYFARIALSTLTLPPSAKMGGIVKLFRYDSLASLWISLPR
jgi:hypothetical protein